MLKRLSFQGLAIVTFREKMEIQLWSPTFNRCSHFSLCSSGYAKNYTEKLQSIIHAGKENSVIPNSQAYLLTSCCNLVSVKELKSLQISITKNTDILLCSLNTSVYTKWIQRSCTLEYLEHYQISSLFPLLPAEAKAAFHNVSFFNY